MAASDKPYMFINDQMQSYFVLKTQVGGGAKFDVLNVHIRNQLVMPGQLVIVPDESTQTLLPAELEMMGLAQDVRHKTINAERDLLENYDLLQNMLNYGSLGLGSASSAWAKHLDEVEKTLTDIEKLYQLALRRGTPIARQEFINQRRVLFTKLDAQLKGVARWGTGLHNRGSLKKMLGLSTKSYLHTREIRGYAERVGKISKASKILKHGTAIGIGLNITASGLEIKEACSMGREDVCTKAKYVEGSKLVGSVAGGYIGGMVGGGAGTGVCAAALGITTGPGALACVIIGGITVGYAGGLGGEKVGDMSGTKLYEWNLRNGN